jgi:cell division transport system ATP-binding protein
MIHFSQLSKCYPNGQVSLSQVSFNLAEAEMAFLTGHSGAGKTTLLKLIALLEKPTTGDIIVNGYNLSRLKMRYVPHLRRQIGLIFQTPHLLFERTVFENVAIPLIIAGYRSVEIGRRVRAALDKVGLLDKEKLLPVTLSCGEQQRVGIARAIVGKPPIILADEPTGNLDPELSKEIMQLFTQFNQVGVTVLIATHDVELIKQLPYRILTLKQGRLVNDVGGERHDY